MRTILIILLAIALAYAAKELYGYKGNKLVDLSPEAKQKSSDIKYIANNMTAKEISLVRKVHSTKGTIQGALEGILGTFNQNQE